MDERLGRKQLQHHIITDSYKVCGIFFNINTVEIKCKDPGCLKASALCTDEMEYNRAVAWAMIWSTRRPITMHYSIIIFERQKQNNIQTKILRIHKTQDTQDNLKKTLSLSLTPNRRKQDSKRGRSRECQTRTPYIWRLIIQI